MGPSIQCPRPVLTVLLKHCCTNPQLEVAMLRKRRKVRSRAMNVPIVVHAMEAVDCVPATRDTLENRARPKPSWSKEGHSFIAWTAKFIMWFWQHMLQPKNIISCRIGKLVKFVHCCTII